VLAVGDIKFQKKCLGKMGDVARGGRTVILVSHQLNQIRRLCQRTIWVDAGKVRQNGPTAEVVSAYEMAMSASDRTDTPSQSRIAAKAQFVSWKIEGKDESSRYFLDEVGEATVTFRLDVRQRIERGIHGVALFDSDRRLVWALSKDELTFDPGTHELSYTFPFLPLCPRAYSWQVSLWEEGESIDLWEAVPEMIVTSANYQHAKDEWNGYLNLPSVLQIDSRKGQP
jgi:hypothetical protein